jgi:hypothetical protein
MSIDREIIMLEKQLNDMKAKLNNAIIDIRAVNYWGWVDHICEEGLKPEWMVTRHELQYKRQGDPSWVSIPVVDRDDEVINVTLPNGELDE